MKIRELEALRAIFDTGTVSQAARDLGVSQPAVSRMLTRLEQELGFELFYRIGGRLVPTRAAQAIHGEVMRTLNGLSNLERLAHVVKQGRMGEVKIGCSQSLVHSLMPRAVEQFSKEWPDTRVIIDPRPNGTIIDRIASQQLDVALLFLPINHTAVEVEPLAWFDSVCVLSSDHPLASRDMIRPAELINQRLIMLSQTDPARSQIELAFRQAQVVPLTRFETSNVAFAVNLAARNCGIAIVNALMARDVASPETVLVPFKPDIRHQIALIRSPDLPPSAECEVFCQILRETVGAIAAH